MTVVRILLAIVVGGCAWLGVHLEPRHGPSAVCRGDCAQIGAALPDEVLEGVRGGPPPERDGRR